MQAAPSSEPRRRALVPARQLTSALGFTLVPQDAGHPTSSEDAWRAVDERRRREAQAGLPEPPLRTPRWTMDGVATIQDQVLYAEWLLQTMLDGREHSRRLGRPPSASEDHIGVLEEELAEAQAAEQQLFRALQDPGQRDEHLRALTSVLVPELTATPTFIELEAVARTLRGGDRLCAPRANRLTPLIWRWLRYAERRGDVKPHQRPPTAHTPWSGTRAVGYPVDDYFLATSPSDNHNHLMSDVELPVAIEASLQAAAATLAQPVPGFEAPEGWTAPPPTTPARLDLTRGVSGRAVVLMFSSRQAASRDPSRLARTRTPTTP